jgi:hypothetical protein
MPESHDDRIQEEPPTRSEGGSSAVPKDQMHGQQTVPGPRRDVRALRGRATEMEKSEDQPAAPSGNTGGLDEIPGFGMLQALTSMTPFMTYFNFLAVSRFSHQNDEGRIARLAKEHAWTYRMCCAGDLILRAFVVLLLVLVVTTVLFAGVYELFLEDLDVWFVEMLRTPG